jgi:hypothetical protein
MGRKTGDFELKNPFADTLKVYILSNAGDLLTITDLNKNEIVDFMRLKAFSLVAGTEDLAEYIIDFYVRSKISVGRKGRKEIVDVGKKGLRLVQNMYERLKTLRDRADYETEDEF